MQTACVQIAAKLWHDGLYLLELHALRGPHRASNVARGCLVCRQLLAGGIARVPRRQPVRCRQLAILI